MTVYSQIGHPNPDYTMSVASPTVVTLMSMAQQILTVLENTARQMAIDLPSRRIIYMTPAVADCAQYGVLFSGWQSEANDANMIVCQTARWIGRFSVLVTRNTPAMVTKEGQPPSAEALIDAALVASQDAELLLGMIAQFDEMGGDATVETPAAEGGLQTVVATVMLPATSGWS